jgi:hypothetical protein
LVDSQVCISFGLARPLLDFIWQVSFLSDTKAMVQKINVLGLKSEETGFFTYILLNLIM